jgi:hypothetical protein
VKAWPGYASKIGQFMVEVTDIDQSDYDFAALIYPK